MIKRLGELAATEDGKTYTYLSNECSDVMPYILSDLAFGGQNDLDFYRTTCAQRFAEDNPIKGFGYGSDSVRYEFTGDPDTGTTPIRYSSAFIGGIAFAYVGRGTCTLVK
ncbi:MAG: hypothetical protein ABIQ30_10105 [Devosia sp.]